MTKSGDAREAGGESTHRRAALALAVGMLAVLVGCDPARAAPRIWHVDTSQSRLVMHVFRKGLLSPVLHDHHFVRERWACRYFTLQLAESYLTRPQFRQIVARIERLAWHPT
jgi:hypothetical protein